MSSEGLGEMIFGILFVIVPILALLFGSNEPAMQTDEAALFVTVMIVFGVIMFANGSSKRKRAKGVA